MVLAKDERKLITGSEHYISWTFKKVSSSTFNVILSLWGILDKCTVKVRIILQQNCTTVLGVVFSINLYFPSMRKHFHLTRMLMKTSAWMRKRYVWCCSTAHAQTPTPSYIPYYNVIDFYVRSISWPTTHSDESGRIITIQSNKADIWLYRWRRENTIDFRVLVVSMQWYKFT